jgi:hypothetical protein
MKRLIGTNRPIDVPRGVSDPGSLSIAFFVHRQPVTSCNDSYDVKMRLVSIWTVFSFHCTILRASLKSSGLLSNQKGSVVGLNPNFTN